MQSDIQRERLLRWKKRGNNQCKQDYLMELAEINGYDGIKDLCRHFSITYPDLMNMNQKLTSSLLRGENISFPKMDYKTRDYWRYRNPWLDSSARICPACLEENAHIPNEFNLSLTIYCHKHGIHLVDRCPQCKESITYHRQYKCYCKCGFDLRRSTRLTIQGWEHTFYTFVAPWRISKSKPLRQTLVKQHELSSLKILDAIFNDGKSHRYLKLTSSRISFLSKFFLECGENIRNNILQRMDNMRIGKLMIVAELLDKTPLPLLDQISVELDLPTLLMEYFARREQFDDLLPYARRTPPPNVPLSSWRMKTGNNKKLFGS